MGDFGDLGDINLSLVGENVKRLADLSSEGENRDAGEKRDAENDLAAE